MNFWNRVDKTGECWLWTGSKSAAGYGQITVRQVRLYTHRLSWEMANGPIPKGMFVCHRCDIRSCVRPDHLFLGTAGDNARDALGKGRLKTRTKQSHCKRGHVLAGDNLYFYPAGNRSCRTCRAEWKARTRGPVPS